MTLSLRAACEDPDLLGIDLWPAQARMADALDDGAGVLVAALGRRSGKTTLAAAAMAHDALLRPDLDGLVRPGETRYAVAIAPGLRQARLNVAATRTLVEASPILSRYLVSATEDELRFERPGGVRTAVAAFPCNSRGARGWAISCLVLDELAHFLSDTDGPATADRVWAALTPALAQFGPLGRILACSTPLGSDGLFARLYEEATGNV